MVKKVKIKDEEIDVDENYYVVWFVLNQILRELRLNK